MTPNPDPQPTDSEFEKYATDHVVHPHCAGCGGCILDPRCAAIRPAWCVNCYERIDKSMPHSIPRPWDGDGMVLFDYDGRFGKMNIFEAWAFASRFGSGNIILKPEAPHE